MVLADVIDTYLRLMSVSKAADLSLQKISSSIGQTPLRAFNPLQGQDWIAERQALGLKASSIIRHLGRLSQVLRWAQRDYHATSAAHFCTAVLGPVGVCV